MARAAALRRLSCSSSRMQPFLWSSLCYMSSLTSESVCVKKKSRVTKRLNTPLEVVDPEIADIHELENARPWEGVDLIPSESFTSVSVNQAVGSIMINKYREAYPGARYYGLIEFIDTLETLWQNRALAMFRLDPEKWGVIVQSVPEELAHFQLYSALLKPHKRIMALDVDRPYPSQCQTDTKKIFAVSIFFETMPYRLDESTGYVDSNQLEKSAALFRPKLIVTRTQAYDSVHEYAHLRKVCDKHEAILLADMARFGGLVALGYVPSPFKYADIVTAIDQQTLRGPRGPMIFFRKGVKKIKKQGKQGKEVLYDFEDKINEAVFPGLQDVALKQGTTPEYKAFQEQVLSNCARFAQILVSKGYEIVSCGSENHLVLVNVKNKGIDAFRVKTVLTFVNILADERTVPGDVSATDPGGIVMGTLALTSRGFIEEDFTEVANFFDSAVNLALKIKAVTEEHHGKKFLHFERAIYYDTEIRAEIKQLRHDINQYATQFASIGFGKETLTYKL